MDDMWNLPRSIELGGEQYEVRTDFRAILDILRAMADPELNEEDRIEVLFDIFSWMQKKSHKNICRRLLTKRLHLLTAESVVRGKTKPG